MAAETCCEAYRRAHAHEYTPVCGYCGKAIPNPKTKEENQPMTQLLGRMHALDYVRTLGVDAAMVYLREREDNARPEYIRGYTDAMLAIVTS